MEKGSIETVADIEKSNEVEEADEVLEEEEVVDPRTLFTKEQVEYFKQIFMGYDPENKGKIPAKTVGIVLRSMGLNPTKAEIKEHIKEIDPLNKGFIDFYSFLLPIAKLINQEPENHEDIIAAFKMLDEEENDYITTDKLYEFLTTLGEDLEDYEIEILLKMAETKGTGRIYYQEFVEKLFGIVKKQPKKKNKDKKKKGKK